MERSCASCAFFRTRRPDETLGERGDDFGLCRRYPPQVIPLIGQDLYTSGYPQTPAEELCGEHRPRES